MFEIIVRTVCCYYTQKEWQKKTSAVYIRIRFTIFHGRDLRWCSTRIDTAIFLSRSLDLGCERTVQVRAEWSRGYSLYMYTMLLHNCMKYVEFDSERHSTLYKYIYITIYTFDEFTLCVQSIKYSFKTVYIILKYIFQKWHPISARAAESGYFGCCCWRSCADKSKIIFHFF